MHQTTLSPDPKLADTGQLELVSSGLLDRPTLFGGACSSLACVWTSAGRLTLLEDSPLTLTTPSTRSASTLTLTSYQFTMPDRAMSSSTTGTAAARTTWASSRRTLAEARSRRLRGTPRLAAMALSLLGTVFGGVSAISLSLM
nr:MAG TPA: hypothetical protein [Caudoviricetes sp.]